MLNIFSTAFGVRVGLANVIVVGLHLSHGLSDFLTLARGSPTGKTKQSYCRADSFDATLPMKLIVTVPSQQIFS